MERSGQSDVFLRNLGKKWFPCEMQYAGFPLHRKIETFDNYHDNGNESIISKYKLAFNLLQYHHFGTITTFLI